MVGWGNSYLKPSEIFLFSLSGTPNISSGVYRKYLKYNFVSGIENSRSYWIVKAMPVNENGFVLYSPQELLYDFKVLFVAEKFVSHFFEMSPQQNQHPNHLIYTLPTCRFYLRDGELWCEEIYNALKVRYPVLDRVTCTYVDYNYDLMIFPTDILKTIRNVRKQQKKKSGDPYHEHILELLEEIERVYKEGASLEEQEERRLVEEFKKMKEQ